MIKKMINIIIGMFLGIVLLYLFVHFGGADYLMTFGRKTEQAGEELKQYEKDIKDTTIKFEKMLEKAKDKVKDKVP